jgi:predicted dehydrogenase
MRRKDFLHMGALFSGGLFSGTAFAGKARKLDASEAIEAAELSGSVFEYADAPIKKVRVAMVGLGNRGSTLVEMLGWLVRHDHAEIVAICDVQTDFIERARKKIAGFQKTVPMLVDGSSDELAWQQMCNTEIADIIIVATPWRWHAPMAQYAMEQGIHVATEVPMGYTAIESLELIKTAERTQRHCIMLENCCYNGEELFVLNMVKEGVFGDLTHAECAYIHDLRQLMMDTKYYHERWRLNHHLERDGNFYTTHGL